MKKILLLLLIIPFLMGCEEDYDWYKSSKLPLRQLNKSQNKIYKSESRFFLVSAYGSSKEVVENKIQMYALADSAYNYLEYDIKKVKIKIDNNIVTPFITAYIWTSSQKYRKNKQADEIILSDTQNNYYYYDIILTCPEKYLPEELLPINIK